MTESRRVGVEARAWAVAAACGLACSAAIAAQPPDPHRFDDGAIANVEHPAWFKQSFLDLREDLRDARKAKKLGVILFFGTRTCSYCKVFLETTFADPAIRGRVQRHFDVIGLEVISDLEITDAAGRTLPVREFAVREKARFTPTLVFHGVDGTRFVSIVGYYPPEKFSAVLDYVIDGHHAREPLGSYLARRGEARKSSGRGIRHDAEVFARPPYILDRRAPGPAKPLLILFERPDCDACERFHRGVLSDAGVRSLLRKFEAVQLDLTDDRTPVLTPAGEKLTPRKWAAKLALAYAPALVFFDERGTEVLRIDSETLKHRMEGSLQYVLEKGYLKEQQFQRWRNRKAIEAAQGK